MNKPALRSVFMVEKITPVLNFLKAHVIKISVCIFLVVVVSSVMLVDKPCACVEMPVFGIAAERIHADEISIMQTLDPGSSRWDAPRYPYQILLNGHDLSSMDSIRLAGLSDTITPPEGLLNQKGSCINLTGPEVMTNTTGGVHLVIIETFSNGQKFAVYDTTV